MHLSVCMYICMYVCLLVCSGPRLRMNYTFCWLVLTNYICLNISHSSVPLKYFHSWPTDSLGKRSGYGWFRRAPWWVFPGLMFENPASSISNLSSNQSESYFTFSERLWGSNSSPRLSCFLKGSRGSLLPDIPGSWQLLKTLFCSWHFSSSPKGQFSSKWLPTNREEVIRMQTKLCSW